MGDAVDVIDNFGPGIGNAEGIIEAFFNHHEYVFIDG